MTHTRLNLATLEVLEPCHVPWKEMTGDNQRRFCGHCQKHVHNLSAMTGDEAERVICASAGSLCVRYEQTSDGKMITLDYQPKIEKKRRWLWPVSVISGVAVAAGFIFVGVKPKPTMGAAVMGNLPPMPVTSIQGGATCNPFPTPATQPTAGVNTPISLPMSDSNAKP